MKKTLAAGLVGLSLSFGLMAGAPAVAQAPAAPAALSVESTPIEALVANPAAKAVLDKDVPGLTTHEAYDQFKAMTLSQVAPMSQGALTDDMLKTVQADLDKLPK
ncbi:hypothetical protein JKL49_09955 [Phenylobacterium sp. 20VBR1]|uniref:Uncharacterized protein n=1 Tax=Phenylobacterium glaciei TaxID=2803784 RepID=A0A941HW42_9CAUL|nr:hypothetical protein [Phenylobacterium glaciei]MBR7619711.1 hypothetical protein [Phenylobacterium glaciei]QQZ48733.1 hypothetical protein JKL49_14915 [Phenylobacterium glaciei]